MLSTACVRSPLHCLLLNSSFSAPVLTAPPTTLPGSPARPMHALSIAIITASTTSRTRHCECARRNILLDCSVRCSPQLLSLSLSVCLILVQFRFRQSQYSCRIMLQHFINIDTKNICEWNIFIGNATSHVDLKVKRQHQVSSWSSFQNPVCLLM